MIRREIENLIKDSLKKVVISDSIMVSIRPSSRDEFGDYSAIIAPGEKLPNGATIYGKMPEEILKKIVEDIKKRPDSKNYFDKIDIKAPFINFFLSKEYLQKQVNEILKQGEKFGELDIGQGKKVQVEFISANPTGPLTLGNGRGGFMGDTLANVLAKAGYNVRREYFINDTGHQIEVLGHSVLKDEKAQYKGDYIDLLHKKLTGFLKTKDPKKVGEKAAVYIMEKMIKPTIAERMKIKFDKWVSEKRLHKSGEIEKIVKILKEKGLAYEKEGALWFKSSKFGGDKDRVLITSEKSTKGKEATYFLADTTYHYNKFFKEKFDKVIDLWGADHHGFVARLKAAKMALEMPGELEIIIIQLVRLFESGKEVKMSKRAGTYVTLDELLEEIPLDVARFFFLMRSPDTHMDFNLDLAKRQSEKNPVYYVQYAYARICSILAKLKSQNSNLKTTTQSLNLLNRPAELDLIKQLIRLPEIIEDTAKDYQVQRLPQYVLDLVTAFHKFYEECRVISQDKNLTQARLGLVKATKIVLKNTLNLIGISAPEHM